VQQRGLQFQRLRLIYSFIFCNTYPQQFSAGGIFLTFLVPAKFFKYKSISRSRAAEKLIHNLKFRIQNCQQTADRFPSPLS